MSLRGPVHSARAGPALQTLAETDPALAALSLWCQHRDGAATGTRGSTITYGPDFEALAPHEQIGLAAHHILHVALRHPARMADFAARYGAHFDDALYNLAADALVNEALLQAEYALPRPAVRLTDLVARATGQTLTPEAALAGWDVDRLYHALSGSSDGQDGAARSAQAAQKYAQEQEFETDLAPEEGAEDGSGSAEEAAEQAARWRQHLTRALDAGRQAGRGLGRIGHRIADIPEPRTPWEVILRRLLSRAVTVLPNRSPHRPSRRWIAGTAHAGRSGGPMPAFEPGQRLLGAVPRIAVALDASGSIDEARLAVFWAEVSGIARRLRAELHLLVFDEAIRHAERIDPSQTRFALPPMPRGGGTAFVPVIAAAQAMEAAALVVLTDLDGEAGPAPRGMPVIWAVPDAGPLEPPFGQLLDLTR